jgi:putative ABC transport system permease protein
MAFQSNRTYYIQVLSDMWHDLRYAWRISTGRPGFTVAAVAILALGIGATTAVFAILDALMLRPLPVWQPERLAGFTIGWSLPDYRDLENDREIFSEVAAYVGLPLALRSSESVLMSGRAVSANFFQTLGLKLAAGRGFLPEEDMPLGNVPAVISYRLWQRSFGRDPNILGRALDVNRELLTIVGVAPKDLSDIQVGGPHQDVWVPIWAFGKVMHVDEAPYWRDAQVNRGLRWLTALGRFRSGVELTQARARFAVIADNLRTAYPDSHRKWNPALLSMDRIRWPEGNKRFVSVLLVGAALAVLLIVCTNIAGMLLARGQSRQREIATRLSLGASRGRLVRQLLTEGLVLSGLGLASSVAVCVVALRWLASFDRGIIPPLYYDVGQQLARHLGLGFNTRLFALGFGIALLTTLMFGLAPALAGSRLDLIGALKSQSSASSGATRFRGRRILLVTQVFLSAVLLIAAGVFVRTLLHFGSLNPGFDGNVLLLDTEFFRAHSDPNLRLTFYRESLDQVRRLPGVRSAAWAEDVPFDRGFLEADIQLEVEDALGGEWQTIRCNAIGSSYFSTLGIPILSGRDFTDQDIAAPSPTVIINETMVRQYWPGNINPLGKRMRVRVNFDGEYRVSGVYEVVGVVKAVRDSNLWEAPAPCAFFPYSGFFDDHLTLHVSTLADPRSLAGSIRKICESVNPNVVIPVETVRLLSAQTDYLLSQERSSAEVLGIFGSLALLLAAAGLYGVVSCSTLQRSQEFGIRMALGARPSSIFRLVLMDGITLVAVGLALALPCSIALSRFIASRLHGLSPYDPVTYGLVSLLCLAVAFVAILLPARRAISDPMTALRRD